MGTARLRALMSQSCVRALDYINLVEGGDRRVGDGGGLLWDWSVADAMGHPVKVNA